MVSWPQVQRGFEESPRATSPGCSQQLWESRGKPKGSYRPRTGKSERAKRWKHSQAHGELCRYWEGLCPIQSGVGVLQLAWNYELSKMTLQGSLLGQNLTSEETTGNRIKTEQDWRFGLRAGPPKQVKIQVQTLVLTTLPPTNFRQPGASLFLWGHYFVEISGYISAAQHLSLFETVLYSPSGFTLISIN